MIRFILFVWVVFWLPKSSYCQETVGNFHAAPFPYLHSSDSVLLYLKDGHLMYDHLIEKNQTLFSISKYYGLDIKLLYDANPWLMGEKIKIGGRLKIPIPINVINDDVLSSTDSNYAPCFYKVSKGETLFGIARRVFNSSTARLIEINHLNSIDLRPGQLMLVGWINTSGISPFKRAEELSERKAESREQWSLDSGFVNRDLMLRQDKNLAFWNKGSHQKGLLVLHKYIAPGTIIEIYNPNMDIAVKAKVIGRILPGTYPKDIDMIVSSAVADHLGAIDPRFYVKVKYYQ